MSLSRLLVVFTVARAFLLHRKQRVKGLVPRLNTESEDDTFVSYSDLFQRHVVVVAGKVEKSYRFLDDALTFHPGSRMVSMRQLPGGIAGVGRLTRCSVSQAEEADSFYQFKHGANSTLQEISHVFEAELQWFPSQIEKMVSLCPHLLSFAPNDIRDRIRFFMAPLPDSDTLGLVNTTEEIDWPVLFYRRGFGAGMSLAQTSHALQTVPYFLFPAPDYSSQVKKMRIQWLYKETPSSGMILASEQLKPWLPGTETWNAITLAYLHWNGWKWVQCRVLLHAIPNLLTPSIDWGVEALDYGDARAERLYFSLSYLQLRLSLRPWQIEAMIKTYTRLPDFQAKTLGDKMDLFQDLLLLTSLELRNALLIMPSLLGMSLSSIRERCLFWQSLISTEDLRTKVLPKMPALLQYSVRRNLHPKLVFFNDELCISKDDLKSLTLSRPEIWAFSLEGKVRPFATQMTAAFGNMPMQRFGEIVVKIPALLCLNWATNVSRKLQVLEQRLCLSPSELQTLVTAQPRILIQSMASLRNTLEMITKDEVHLIVSNPYLLTLQTSTARERLQQFRETKNADLLAKGYASKAPRRKKRVLMSVNGSQIVFDSVADAADHCGTSRANMYDLIRTKRQLGGATFSYFEDDKTTADENVAPIACKDQLDGVGNPEVVLPLGQTACFRLQVSGRAFPLETSIRGRRRAGGMAIHIPALNDQAWARSLDTVWRGRPYLASRKLRTVLLGYPYIRPSSRRCSLYACREALTFLVSSAADLSGYDEINIAVNNRSVYSLLSNTTRLIEWGLSTSEDAFVKDYKVSVNSDILYPLARTFRLAALQIESKIVFSSAEWGTDSFKYIEKGAIKAARYVQK